MTRPPRVAVRLLAWRLHPDHRDDVIGDLDEQFIARVSAVGPARARRWYWRETLDLVGGMGWRRDPFAIDGSRSRRVWMPDTWTLDLRHAWRSLGARRGSALATMAVFAIGVGLLSAIFALADPFILRPLPFARPGELVAIDVRSTGLSPDARIPTLDEWRARGDLFKDIAASRGGPTVQLKLADGSVMFRTGLVTENFFDLLGVPVARYAPWRATTWASTWRPSRAGPDPSDLAVIVTPHGRTALRWTADERDLRLTDGGAVRVAGVLSDTFLDLVGCDGLAAYEVGPVIDAYWSPDGSSWGYARHDLIARLQPSVTPDVVQRALAVPLPSGGRLDVTVEPLADRRTRAMRPLALGAFGAGLLILFVCAGNVANLLLARGTYRAQEFATREALGATRLDVARLWLAELGLVALAGATAGLAIAWIALHVAAGVIPAQYVALGAPDVSARVVAFALLAGAAVAIVGLVPAVLVSRVAPRTLLARRASTAGPRVQILRVGFGAVQAALAMVLAVGAAMLLQSSMNLLRRDPGYDGAALTVHVSYRPASAAVVDETVRSSIDRLKHLPGVQAVSATTQAVMDGQRGGGVTLDGRPGVFVFDTFVRPEFFDAAGMTIVQGRPLGEGDHDWRAVVVNQAFVRQYLPATPPLGHLLTRSARQGIIVGVVRDVLDGGLAAAPRPTVYSLMTEVPSPVVYVFRAIGDPAGYREPIRRALVAVNDDAVVSDVDTIDRRLRDSVRDRTFATLVLTMFCLAGGGVTVAGLAGIASFVVARRTREIAIRIAIGATGGDVRRLVAREALSAAVIGGTAGLLIGRWLSTWLTSFTYGVEAGNWTTAVVAGAVMLVVMVAAALAPAGRAVNLQPTEALRVE